MSSKGQKRRVSEGQNIRQMKCVQRPTGESKSQGLETQVLAGKCVSYNSFPAL